MSNVDGVIDLAKNFIPDNVSKVHLIAVCGTAMGAVACMLQEMGLDVAGSDSNVYPPMSDFLREHGIRIHSGFDPSNLNYGPDLVIVGNAVSRDNPEVREMARLGLPFCSMPQAVNHFAAKGKQILLVTGTHGKTTTASLLAWVLTQAGMAPSFLIGGILKDFGSNYQTGHGPFIVIEGDEYDTAFFDKGPKFLHYSPHTAILTGIEFDHADIYRDLDHVNQAFDRFLSNIQPDATLVAFGNDPNAMALISDRSYDIQIYGQGSNANWTLDRVTIEPPWTQFQIIHDQEIFGQFQTRLMGHHNLLNILAVSAVAHRLAIPVEKLANALESFQGVRRRQEVRGTRNGITVMDDFAHHPTAVRETIRAVKPHCPNGRLIAVFEPRTNTSMRNIFQDVYPKAFDLADVICVREPPLLNKIPENQRFSSKKLVDDLKKRNQDAHYFSDTDAIIEFIGSYAKSGDVILIMSNGGFDNIHQRLLNLL